MLVTCWHGYIRPQPLRRNISRLCWKSVLQLVSIQNRIFHNERLTDWDWDKFIQHNMTLYRCMISDIHDSSYVLFRTNLISNTSLHVGRPLLRPCLVAYAEATLARQKDSATNEKCWHHFRILIVDKWSVVWNECKKSWVPNDRLEKPLIPCNMISN